MYYFVGALFMLLFELIVFAMGVYAVMDYMKTETPDLYTAFMRRNKARKRTRR